MKILRQEIAFDVSQNIEKGEIAKYKITLGGVALGLIVIRDIITNRVTVYLGTGQLMADITFSTDRLEDPEAEPTNNRLILKTLFSSTMVNQLLVEVENNKEGE